MIKKCLVLFLCLGLTGCASELSQKYSMIYDNALNTGDMTIIVKHSSYQQLKQQLGTYLTSMGYTRVVLVNPKQGFIVLAKEQELPNSQIILKYTATAGDYNIRVELANGSEDLSNNSEVARDIQEIAELIRNE